MTYGAWEVVGREVQELPIGTTIGDALRRLIIRRFKHNTVKTIENQWNLDPKTAKNVVQRGCVSERTLTKAALAERWNLWMALGEELFEEPYAAHLARLVDERECAARDAAEARTHVLSLEARAAELFALLDGPNAASPGNGADAGRRGDDGSRSFAPQTKVSRRRLTDGGSR